MRRILVTDGDQRAALAVVRSLGRAGHAVHVCSTRGRSMAGASRYALVEGRVPDPMRDPDRFAGAIERLAADWRVDTVIPVAEPALLAVLSSPERFSHLCVPFPDLERVRRISDKGLLTLTAPEVGIAVPEQVVLEAPGSLPTPELARLRYPVVIKPGRSVGEAGGGLTKLGVRHAASLPELKRRLGELPGAAYPVLLQQRVVGPGVGIFLLLWEGRTYGLFAHRRIREKPPAGGVSVYRESVPADPSLVAKSRALLERFEWRGVAMVEYKIEAASGTPYLMEVNGRFWGSLQLALDAGVDFPALLVGLAHGERPDPVTTYQSGVRSRWWWGDVDHLLARLRRSDRDLALPPGAPSRWSAVADFFKLWRPGDRSEVLRLEDPRPFIRETIEWFRNL